MVSMSNRCSAPGSVGRTTWLPDASTSRSYGSAVLVRSRWIAVTVREAVSIAVTVRRRGARRPGRAPGRGDAHPVGIGLVQPGPGDQVVPGADQGDRRSFSDGPRSLRGLA